MLLRSFLFGLRRILKVESHGMVYSWRRVLILNVQALCIPGFLHFFLTIHVWHLLNLYFILRRHGVSPLLIYLLYGERFLLENSALARIFYQLVLWSNRKFVFCLCHRFVALVFILLASLCAFDIIFKGRAFICIWLFFFLSGFLDWLPSEEAVRNEHEDYYYTCKYEDDSEHHSFSILRNLLAYKIFFQATWTSSIVSNQLSIIVLAFLISIFICLSVINSFLFIFHIVVSSDDGLALCYWMATVFSLEVPVLL